MPIYQMNNYMLLQIKEKNFIDEFKPKLNKTWIIHTHTQMETNKQTYIYIYYIHTHKISRHREKISQIRNHSNIYTQCIKYQK